MRSETFHDPPKSDWTWALVSKRAAYYQIIKQKKVKMFKNTSKFRSFFFTRVNCGSSVKSEQYFRLLSLGLFANWH